MKKRKIFIEIGVPEHLSKRLAQKVLEWKDLPVKWIRKENLHLTIAYVGYVGEEVLPELCQKVQDVAKKFESFEIVFDRIELSPVDNSRLIQLSGVPSEELRVLNEEMEKALGMMPPKHKQFSPHITLGRIRRKKWDELQHKPIINEKFSAAMPIESVLVMESIGEGAEYASVEECPLQ